MKLWYVYVCMIFSSLSNRCTIATVEEKKKKKETTYAESGHGISFGDHSVMLKMDMG